MKLIRRFREFLRDEVNPNRERLGRLYVGVRGVKRHLETNLRGYQRIDRQGSLGLDTLIKPVRDDDGYDADIQVVMNPTPNWEPRDYLQALSETLAQDGNYADKIRLGTRCVTLDFAGNFHLDVVPRITEGGTHLICNRATNCFEPTDGTGFRDWFSDKSRITKVNLKRVVRLLKYLRDRQDNYVAKSILLTTLAGNAIRSSDREEESVRTVADTLTTVLTRMDHYLQAELDSAANREPCLVIGRLQPPLGSRQVQLLQRPDSFPRCNSSGSPGFAVSRRLDKDLEKVVRRGLRQEAGLAHKTGRSTWQAESKTQQAGLVP